MQNLQKDEAFRPSVSQVRLNTYMCTCVCTYSMSCTANRRILHCTYYVKKTYPCWWSPTISYTTQECTTKSKSFPKWTLVSSGRKQVIIKWFLLYIYIYSYIQIDVDIPFTCEFNHPSWLPDDLVHQRHLFFFEVPNATDVSWNEEFEFPVTPVKNSGVKSVKLGNRSAGAKSFAVFYHCTFFWNKSIMWVFPKMVGFPPKSSILIGISIINHPFWGTPIFWKHPCDYISCDWKKGSLDQQFQMSLLSCRFLVFCWSSTCCRHTFMA